MDNLIPHIQKGIEIEAFAKTKAGACLLADANEGAGQALSVILDGASDDAHVLRAVMELRLYQRLITLFAHSIRTGRQAERILTAQEHEDPI